MASVPGSLCIQQGTLIGLGPPSNPKMKKSKRKARIFVDFESVIKEIESKELTILEAVKKYQISYKTLHKRLNRPKSSLIFTKEQEIIFRDHIMQLCKTQYELTNIIIRKMAYEYAQKLPECKYPKKWDLHQMAGMDWFMGFRSRHYCLKKSLANKLKHTCICITGCHMGPEGKDAFKHLEAKQVIARVFHYLQKEYEYMKTCNDMGLLVNVLRRAAEATGVCEQTITSLLEDEKRACENVPVPMKIMSEMSALTDHDYISKKKYANRNKNAVADKVSSSEIPDNTEYSDFERLQQDVPFIKSVKVEIMENDSDQEDVNTLVIDNNEKETTDQEDVKNLVIDCNEMETSDQQDVKNLVIDNKEMETIEEGVKYNTLVMDCNELESSDQEDVKDLVIDYNESDQEDTNILVIDYNEYDQDEQCDNNLKMKEDAIDIEHSKLNEPEFENGDENIKKEIIDIGTTEVVVTSAKKKDKKKPKKKPTKGSAAYLSKRATINMLRKLRRDNMTEEEREIQRAKERVYYIKRKERVKRQQKKKL